MAFRVLELFRKLPDIVGQRFSRSSLSPIKTIRPKKRKKTYPSDRMIADLISDIAKKTIGLP